ncbi:hypothetical protein DVH24_026012 [Malus domestica]|uniref:Serine-threonine kinase receptor-associated protein n=1 Tax=Malus domestica TaxID=3750 RepID=A0A498KHJ8_MALDO|nr:hypothetical protein DVH24_026012 [Malus domestica]
MASTSGHNGAVWCCDVSRDSSRLITGSGDKTAKLWDVQTGRLLFTFNFDSPARAVDLSVGDWLAVITTDPFMGVTSAIHVGESILILKGPKGRINRAVWGPLNRTIISTGEDAVIRIWDAELWDTRELTLIKTYVTERPVNAVAMSPLLDHVVLGGGQYAGDVTRTVHRAGKFEAKFYDKILEEEIGGVKGHFGPLNALAFNPDGRRYSSIP